MTLDDNETERAMRKLLRHSDSYRDEWRRLVEENEDLQRGISRLRGKWGLPMRGSLAWWVVFTEEQLREMRNDLALLIACFDIPEHLHEGLWTYLLWGWKVLVMPWGFPTGQFTTQADGSLKHELIITPETDIDNPIVLKFIQDWVHENQNDPPRPVRGARGKLDWRPVLEWKKRHPATSHEKIDAMLGYARGVTRRKLAEIEARDRDDEIYTKDG